jgi:soluble lytic murein transglycosylase-like protein
MPVSALSFGAGFIALAIAISASDRSIAADPSSPAGSEFRLSHDLIDSFRLAKTAPSTNGIAEHPAVSPQLVDKPYAALIEYAARDADIDPALVHAVVHAESRYNPAARSPKGALGLMQVLPATALRYGVTDVGRSPEINLRVGTRYMRDLTEQFDGRLDLALAAYNAGENAVLRYGARIPPYRETQLYVSAVLAKYRELRESRSATPPHKEYLPGTRLILEASDPGFAH